MDTQSVHASPGVRTGLFPPSLPTVRNTLDSKIGASETAHGHWYTYLGKASLAFPRILHNADDFVFGFQYLVLINLNLTTNITLDYFETVMLEPPTTIRNRPCVCPALTERTSSHPNNLS